MNLKKEKGITLIALVITIIVLLILAGVTISMVLDDDGIIAQAQGAQKAQTEGELKEKIELWNGNVEIAEKGGEEITVEEYEKFKTEVEALADKLEIAEEDVKVSEGKITIDEEEIEILFPSNIITFTVCGCKMLTEKGTTWEEFLGNGISIDGDLTDISEIHNGGHLKLENEFLLYGDEDWWTEDTPVLIDVTLYATDGTNIMVRPLKYSNGADSVQVAEEIKENEAYIIGP